MKGSVMLNIDRVWARCSQLNQFRGKKMSDYVLQKIVQNFTLTTGQVSAQTAVQFPAGMILVGINAAAGVSTQLGTTLQTPGLDMFACSIDYQATNRNIVGTSRARGSAVFGQFGDQFPEKELVIPLQGSLLYTVENLTTSTIIVSFAHAGLVPGAIG